jgi:hypothetical protein
MRVADRALKALHHPQDTAPWTLVARALLDMELWTSGEVLPDIELWTLAGLAENYLQ